MYPEERSSFIEIDGAVIQVPKYHDFEYLIDPAYQWALVDDGRLYATKDILDGRHSIRWEPVEAVELGGGIMRVEIPRHPRRKVDTHTREG